MNKRKVGIVRHQLGLGGADIVSLRAIRYLTSIGISTYYFAQSIRPEEIDIDPQLDLDFVYLPDRKHFCCTANFRAIIAESRRLGIDTLFIASGMPGFAAFAKRYAPDIKLVYWLHSIPFWESRQKIEHNRMKSKRSWVKKLRWYAYFVPKYIYGNRLEKRVKAQYLKELELYDHYIVLCPAYKQALIEAFDLSDALAQKICVLYNTIDINEHVVKEKENRLIYVGRLSLGDKRADRVIKIWRACEELLPNWSLHLYGRGEEGEVLKKMAKSLGLQRCFFEGHCTDMQPIYDRAAILLLTSNFEGWGMVLTEAQNNGVIPITYNSSAGVEAIVGKDSQYGLLIPPYHQDLFVSQLVALCHDKEWQKRLQENILKKRYDYCDSANEQTWQMLLGLTPNVVL